MTNEQIQWASQHHWFDKQIGKDTILVKDRMIFNGKVTVNKLLFKNWFELHKWIEVSWLTNHSY